MAKSAKRPAAKAAPKKGGMRPVLIAAGLGLYWFVQYQDADGATDVPIWGYATMVGVRLLADFVGAWLVVTAVQLAFALARLGVAYVRGLWVQHGSAG